MLNHSFEVLMNVERRDKSKTWKETYPQSKVFINVVLCLHAFSLHFTPNILCKMKKKQPLIFVVGQKCWKLLITAFSKLLSDEWAEHQDKGFVSAPTFSCMSPLFCLRVTRTSLVVDDHLTKGSALHVKH